MRIPLFAKLLERSELQPLMLQDSTVVVDALNFFFNSYEESGLQYELGCESHLYASYLKKRLAIFKEVNVKCYFIHKGGNNIIEKRLNTVRESRTICPIFMTSVYREVLDEMGFEYVICEYECKKDIIELARTLDCPIISYDIEFCFSGLRYIPRKVLEFNAADNSIHGRYFSLDAFVQKYRVTAEKLAIFIVLLDESIFPKNVFVEFFRRIHVPSDYLDRYLHLLNWLSGQEKDESLNTIFRYLSEEDRNKFLEEIPKAEQLIFRHEEGGLGAACLLDRASAAVTREDPNWFAKGVAANHVAIHYINLYRHKHLFTAHTINPENPLLLSLEIIRYAYDLLTDFKNEDFTLSDDLYSTDSGMETMVVSETYSIRKPEYDACVCVFENGWDAVRELGLLQHFLRETLQLQELAPLARLPEDARLLVLALLYFSRRKPTDTSAEAACILLSYTTLSVVLEKCDKNNLPSLPIDSKPILEPSTDKNTVTDGDCNVAAAIMKDRLRPAAESAEEIDRGIVRVLEEFQHCLSELNDLNVLCGAPFRPTVYSRTYSGSLVYRLRRAAGAGRWRQFLDGLLASAPTVYSFLNGLIEVYEAM